MSAGMKPLGFCIVCICAALLPFAAWAVTPSGTEINAQATVDCTTSDGFPVDTVISNSVSVSVLYPTGLSIGGAKRLADGQFAELMGTVVIGGTSEIGGAFYIESPDRSTGIRVQTAQTVHEGDLVVVSGMLETANGERRINAADVKVLSSGNTLPEMLHLTPGWYRSSASAIGLLVKVFGRITATPTGASYFYLDDGAPFKDGSGYTGVRVCGIAPSNSVGRFASVVGIPGAEPYGSATIRVVRTRRSEDVSLITGIP